MTGIRVSERLLEAARSGRLRGRDGRTIDTARLREVRDRLATAGERAVDVSLRMTGVDVRTDELLRHLGIGDQPEIPSLADQLAGPNVWTDALQVSAEAEGDAEGNPMVAALHGYQGVVAQSALGEMSDRLRMGGFMMAEGARQDEAVYTLGADVSYPLEDVPPVTRDWSVYNQGMRLSGTDGTNPDQLIQAADRDSKDGKKVEAADNFLAAARRLEEMNRKDEAINAYGQAGDLYYQLGADVRKRGLEEYVEADETGSVSSSAIDHIDTAKEFFGAANEAYVSAAMLRNPNLADRAEEANGNVNGFGAKADRAEGHEAEMDELLRAGDEQDQSQMAVQLYNRMRYEALRSSRRSAINGRIRQAHAELRRASRPNRYRESRSLDFEMALSNAREALRLATEFVELIETAGGNEKDLAWAYQRAGDASILLGRILHGLEREGEAGNAFREAEGYYRVSVDATARPEHRESALKAMAEGLLELARSGLRHEAEVFARFVLDSVRVIEDVGEDIAGLMREIAELLSQSSSGDRGPGKIVRRRRTARPGEVEITTFSTEEE